MTEEALGVIQEEGGDHVSETESGLFKYKESAAIGPLLPKRGAPDPSFYKSGTYPLTLPMLETEYHEYSKPEKKDYTFAQLVGAHFRHSNFIYSIYRDYTNNYKYNLETEGEEEDLIAAGAFDDVPTQFLSNILMHQNNTDRLKALENMKEEMHGLEIIESKGWVQNIPAGIIAMLPDPLTIIPLANVAKTASIAKSIAEGAWIAGKTVAPFAAVRNLYVQQSKVIGGGKEWLIDTAMESFFAASMGGALAAYAPLHLKAKMKATKTFVNAIADDVDVKMVIPETIDGDIKFKAIPVEGSTVGAQHVKNIQDKIDNSYAYLKDYKTVKYIFGWASPLIRGITDRFKTVSKFYQNAFHSPFETAAGVAEAVGDTPAYTSINIMRSKPRNAAVALNELYIESVGSTGFFRNLKAKVGERFKKIPPKHEFVEEVTKAYRRGGKSEIPEARNACAVYKKDVFDPIWETAKKEFPELSDHEATNIVDHLTRIYDKVGIAADPKGFIKDITFAFNKQDKIIADINAPIDAINKQINTSDSLIKDLKSQLKVKNIAKDEKFSIQKTLNETTALKEQQTGRLNELQNELNQRIINNSKDNTIPYDCLEGKPKLTPEQIKELEKLRKPTVDAEANIKTLNKELKKATAPEKKLIREKIKQEEAKIKTADEDILKKIVEGEIEKDFFYFTGKTAKLKDPHAIQKLRARIKPENLPGVCDSVMTNILQQSEEQLAGQIFDGLQSRGNNPVHSRNLMINDADLEKWLINDIDRVASIYADQMARRIYVNRLLNHWAGKSKSAEKGILANLPDEGIYSVEHREAMRGVMASLSEEKNLEKAKILKKPKTPERTKQISKLEEDMGKSLTRLRDGYEVLMGKYINRKNGWTRLSDTVKKLTVAMLLGNVPLLMLTEFGLPLFRATFDNYVSDGIVPGLKMIKNWNDKCIKKYGFEFKEYVRGRHADADLAMNRWRMGTLEGRMGYEKNFQPKILIERFADLAATTSQQLSGANFLMDLQETIVANRAEASLIRYIDRYTSGEKLLRPEVDMLDRAKVNPAKWGDRIMKQYNKYGESSGESFISNYHLWDDLEAQRVFAAGINQDVRNIILLPSPMDKPLIMQDPIASMLTQFMSYIYNANSAFTVPAFTKMDGQKMIGITATLGISSTIGALRSMTRGQEPDLSPAALFAEALMNSAILGTYVEGAYKINSFVDVPFLHDYMGDRYARKYTVGSWGPGASILENMTAFSSSLVNNEMNQRDNAKATKLFLGFTHNWYTNYLYGKLAEQTSKYPNRQKAKLGKKRD